MKKYSIKKNKLINKIYVLDYFINEQKIKLSL